MNTMFRTASMFLRQTWCIEPVFADQHLPLLNAYLNGQLPKQLYDDEDDEEDGDQEGRVNRRAYALALSATGSASAATQTRYALDDPELPAGSVFVLDVRGVIVKESNCCVTGTEDYCAILEQAYQSENIIGNVILVDSPGGQLAGTPSFYDKVRDARKPSVSVVCEGLCASAAYWSVCGSDFIYATQKSDQIGSIGVYQSFKDTTERDAKEGVKTITIYSDRSPQKNKPYKDALAGDETLIKEDLNEAADQFKEAVLGGRGDRIKPAKKGGPDVFEGGLFYASQAIALGLIDGFGDLDTAVAKVVELHEAKAGKTTQTAGSTPKPLDSFAQQQAPAPALTEDTLPTPQAEEPQPSAEAGETSSNPQPQNPMFGFVKLAALAAIQGIAAADVTDAQIDALNAELTAAGFNIGVVSQAQFTEAQTLRNDLTNARTENTRLQGEVTRLGQQPGAFGTQAPKVEEKTGSTESTTVVESDVDKEVKRLRGGK